MYKHNINTLKQIPARTKMAFTLSFQIMLLINTQSTHCRYLASPVKTSAMFFRQVMHIVWFCPINIPNNNNYV